MSTDTTLNPCELTIPKRCRKSGDGSNSHLNSNANAAKLLQVVQSLELRKLNACFATRIPSLLLSSMELARMDMELTRRLIQTRCGITAGACEFLFDPLKFRITDHPRHANGIRVAFIEVLPWWGSDDVRTVHDAVRECIDCGGEIDVGSDSAFAHYNQDDGASACVAANAGAIHHDGRTNSVGNESGRASDSNDSNNASNDNGGNSSSSSSSNSSSSSSSSDSDDPSDGVVLSTGEDHDATVVGTDPSVGAIVNRNNIDSDSGDSFDGDNDNNDSENLKCAASNVTKIDSANASDTSDGNGNDSSSSSGSTSDDNVSQESSLSHAFTVIDLSHVGLGVWQIGSHCYGPDQCQQKMPMVEHFDWSWFDNPANVPVGYGLAIRWSRTLPLASAVAARAAYLMSRRDNFPVLLDYLSSASA